MNSHSCAQFYPHTEYESYKTNMGFPDYSTLAVSHSTTRITTTIKALDDTTSAGVTGGDKHGCSFARVSVSGLASAS